MIRVTVAIPLVLLLLAGLLRAADLDDARIAGAIADDQTALEQARSERDSILQAVHEDDAHMAGLRTRLAGGAGDLPRIEQDLAAAKMRADARREAAQPQQQAYEAARDRLEAARATARADFENAPDFQSLQAAVTAAHQAVEAAEERAIGPLADSSTYRDLQAEIEKDKSRVDYFHRAGPAFIRDEQAASGMLQDATDHLDNLKGQFIYSDPQAMRARARSAAADQALANARADNEQRLETVPEVAAAVQNLQAQAGPYQAAMAVVHAADARAASIQKAHQQTIEGMAADRATLAEVEDDRAQARAALSRVDADIDRISSDLTAALSLADQRQPVESQPSPAAESDGRPVPYWSDPLADFAVPSLSPILSDEQMPPVDDGSLLAAGIAPAPIFIEWIVPFQNRCRHVVDRSVGRHRLDQMALHRTSALAQSSDALQVGLAASNVRLLSAQAATDPPAGSASSVFPLMAGRPHFSGVLPSGGGAGARFHGGEARSAGRGGSSFPGRSWNAQAEAGPAGGQSFSPMGQGRSAGRR